MTNAEAWDFARHLVVGEGRTYAEAAGMSGVPLSTLQKRAGREKWMDQRSHAATYEATVRALKVKLLQSALEADPPDPQRVFAWKQAEAAFPEHRYAGKEDPRLRLAVTVEVIEQLVQYLTEHDRNALSAVQPHLRGFAEAQEARCRLG